MNDLDSFRNLNDIWLKNKKEFEAKIFEKHKPYLLDEHEKILLQEAKDLVGLLL